jgi:hypothetical protein
MGWLIFPIRPGDSASPPAVGDPGGEPNQLMFRAGDTPGTPLPIDPPGPTTYSGDLVDLEGLGGTLGVWSFTDDANSYVDRSFRWVHHDAQLTDPDHHTLIDGSGTKFLGIAWTRELGGGDGPLNPLIGFHNVGGDDPIVDQVNTPVWSLMIEFESLGPVTNDGTPPATHSSSAGRPGTPTLAPQPIIANAYSNGPWLMYLQYTANWVGAAGSWDLEIETTLKVAYGGSGGTTYTISVDGLDRGLLLLEFDNTARVIRLSMFNGHGGWDSLGETPMLPAGAPGGFPQSTQILGGGTLGPYYWTFFVHIFGYITSLAIIGNTKQFSTELLDARMIAPGSGPPMTIAEWRSSPEPAPPTSARLGLYAHFWPLDEASPGPMLDRVVGSRLAVNAPTVATFQVDGEILGTKALRLGPPTSSATMTYLKNPNTGVAADMGQGGLGHDFSVTMRVLWEGPQRSGNRDRALFRSGGVAFGFSTAIAIGGYIGNMQAEPFGVHFRTFDNTHGAFEDLKTANFDWPADRDPSEPWVKVPKWAHVAFVYKTVGAAIEKQIWIDGVLLATGAADPGGWGSHVNLEDLGVGGLGGTLQDFAIWPFALTADEIALVHT